MAQPAPIWLTPHLGPFGSLIICSLRFSPCSLYKIIKQLFSQANPAQLPIPPSINQAHAERRVAVYAQSSFNTSRLFALDSVRNTQDWHLLAKMLHPRQYSAEVETRGKTDNGLWALGERKSVASPEFANRCAQVSLALVNVLKNKTL